MPNEPAEPSPEVAPMQAGNVNPVEPETCGCDESEYCDVCMPPEKQEQWKQLLRGPAAPAESHGVERAQKPHPLKAFRSKYSDLDDTYYGVFLAGWYARDDAAPPVEGPRETCDCEDHPCPYAKEQLRRLAAPVEGVERVTDGTPARVEPHEPVIAANNKGWACSCGYATHRGIGYSAVLEHIARSEPPSIRDYPEATAQPAKHTDDRPAETIPDTVILTGEQFREMKVAAETRIEVLEAVLRDFLEHLDRGVHCCMVTDFQRRKLDAALAAPSGEKRGQEK